MSSNDENQTVDLNSFAEMAGFPLELINKELFNGNGPDGEVSLEDLRKAMISYLDSTMMDK